MKITPFYWLCYKVFVSTTTTGHNFRQLRLRYLCSKASYLLAERVLWYDKTRAEQDINLTRILIRMCSSG